MIYWAIQKSTFSYGTLIAHTQKGLCAMLLSVLGGRDLDDQMEALFPNTPLQYVYDEKYARKIISQLENNININDIPIDFKCGTPFQQLVWSNLRKIPSGTTITYSELAQQINMPKAVRAVASACGKNPLPIIIPCHRVVPKTGGIGKYIYGAQMKTRLLARENIS